jgi:hypothetical protein
MTDVDLDDMQRFADTASPGPWELSAGELLRPEQGGGFTIVDRFQPPIDGDWQQATDNRMFIAAARGAVPALIARLRAAETNLEGERIASAVLGRIPRDELVEAVALLRSAASHIDDRWWRLGDEINAFLARVGQ